MSTTYEKFGNIVKKYRKSKQYSTAKLAEKLNTSVGLINNLENSRHDIFKLELFSSLINELSIPFEEIFEFQNIDLTPIHIDNNKVYIQKNNDISNQNIQHINSSLNIILRTFLNTMQKYNYNQETCDHITKAVIINLEVMQNLNNESSRVPR